MEKLTKSDFFLVTFQIEFQKGVYVSHQPIQKATKKFHELKNQKNKIFYFISILPIHQ